MENDRPSSGGGGGSEKPGGSGASPDPRDAQQAQQGQGQVMNVFGNDGWSVGFIAVLLMMQMLKAMQERCTC